MMKNYRTIYNVAALNRLSRDSFNEKRLKNTSEYLAKTIKKAFDANDGMINAYHIDVWKHEYPHLKY